MNHSLKRFLAWMLVLGMVLGFMPAVHASGVHWERTDHSISASVSERPLRKDDVPERDPEEPVRVSIVLDKPSAVQAGYATMGIGTNSRAIHYRTQLLASQKAMEKTISVQALQGKPLDVVWNMTLVGNIISAWVPYGSLEDIAAIPGVRSVAQEAQYEPAVAARREGAATQAYPSSGMIGSGALWDSGFTGAGSRIAIIDTGTDTDHQSFDNGAYLHALRENAAAKDMAPEAYMASLELLDKEQIDSVLTQLHAYERYEGLTAEDLYRNEKLPFGFNYVDSSLNIVHDDDQQGEHGSHVAGIAAANRYIPMNGGYSDARNAVMMLGVAPDAQIITMKVFGRSAPFDSDYMVAIEDAIMLGCDAVNLSLGTTMPGSPHNDTYSALLELMKQTDTVVTISAGNAGNWADASLFGYLYHDDVSFNTVGSPGSYGSAFTVASVDNIGTVGCYFTASGKTCFYQESPGFGTRDFTTLDKSGDGSGTAYEYVLLDAVGNASDYLGLDVARKIVFVARGTLNFADKVNFAVAKGAEAVVIYNNTDGMFNMDLTGLYYANPVAAISQSDADAIRKASEKLSDIAYGGKMTVYGKMGAGVTNSDDYTMSDFSSWGIPGSLTLKPEITAPGGGVYSVWGSNAVNGGGSDRYETMSGTSMAAPQVAGMTALLAQVFRERGLVENTGVSARHLAQSLLMSTAQPLHEKDSGGNYYALMSQGAGLARVDLAAGADSFIQVLGQEDYKVKAELGDDPLRTGVYTFDFTITNLGGTERVYALDADLFRQDVFEYMPDSDVWLLDNWTTGLAGDVHFYSGNMTSGSSEAHDLNGDGMTSAEDADFLLEYVVGNETALMAEGDLSGDGQINSYDAHLLLDSMRGDAVAVGAGETAAVRVTIALSESAKAELDAETPKGTYVEAFVFARSISGDEGISGTVHSIPVLAFYGDWSEPSMYDRGTLMEIMGNSTTIAPYLHQTIGPYGNALAIDYGNGKEYYYGGNPIVDDDFYIPERNAFNSMDASRLTDQGFTLIRGAGAARIQVRNAVTGEVYFERELGELFPAFYDPAYGAWQNTIQNASLNWSGTDASGSRLPEGTLVQVSLTAVPHYFRQPDGSYDYEGLGSGAAMTTTFTIDNTAPEALDIDVSRIQEDKLVVTARDNRHVAAVALLNANGTRRLRVKTPNQTEHGQTVTLELDLGSVYGREFLVAVYDYANNMTAYRVEMDLGSLEREYFTAIDYNTMTYVGVDRAGQTMVIADTGLPVLARAAEYVGGYVFVITADNSLCVANDEDLSITERICQLDPTRQRLITGVNDMAYNYADGKLYVQYYSDLNLETRPYLATINMDDGSLEDVCELPEDVNTMAIDTQGNFYSAGYNSNKLYTYTLDQITGAAPHLTYVGQMGNFYSAHLSTMAWDHNEDKLYWAFPNQLLQVDPMTAATTLLGYQEATLVGLYTRPEEDEGMFDPVDRVDRVELNHTDSRVVLGSSITLEGNVWPWYASDRSIRWTTSDDSVAVVDENGRVKATGVGECVITAASVLDPGKSASCSITTFALEKTLHAMVGDSQGNVWMSRFSTAEVPEYTKLTDKSLGIDFGAASMGQDGWLYAASLNKSTMRSDLYKLDPETFAITPIGASADAYVDLAPAPGQPGNSLMAVYGGNVLHVDATTGDYYNWYYMFSNNLVGIAYVGTQPYNYGAYDTMVDWYFIIDRLGYVYLMGFLEQDGRYYYLEHDTLAPKGIYTKLDFEMDTPYYGSAYFDGEMLYYSAYKESRDNVTLMAIDVAGGSKACYELGTFPNGVWPVAGLMELGETENHIGVIMSEQGLETMSAPIPAERQTELKGLDKEERVAPMSGAEVGKGQVYVDITLPAADTNADLTVSFDDSMLELTDVSGNTDAFAWRAEGGRIRLALAGADEISNTTAAARLSFRVREGGETVVSVLTELLGAYASGHEERLVLSLQSDEPHAHVYEAVVTEPSCTEPGYTTYTCACGEYYIDDEIPALGHDYHNGVCTRCGDVLTVFTDVPPDSFYYTPVMWAVSKGITTGATPTTFDPNGHCQRAAVVTFLWRAAGSPEPASKVNPFSDVKESDFFYKAVLWAVENHITNGTSATTFSPYGKCNRAQVVTFLWRSQNSPVSDAQVKFTDVKPGQFYSTAVAWAVEKNITNGMGDGTFGIDVVCNRAQVVTFLYRTMA